MKWLADFRKKVVEGWTVQRIAAVLIVVGLVVFVAGILNKHCACVGWPNLGETLNDVISDFYANVSVDCLSIAFAILVIDRLNERRDEQEFKARLIREMASTDNGIALQAVKELKWRGLLKDGSLIGCDLMYANLAKAQLIGTNLQEAFLISANLEKTMLHNANLQYANLIDANLQGADLTFANLKYSTLQDANLARVLLYGANLQGAGHLHNEQLVTAYQLYAATMPDASRYDGRFSLYVDVLYAHIQEGIDLTNPEAMARYYGVTLEDYLAGQEWARDNLTDLRRKAGLDPDTGYPLPTTNGVEPQPADAPTQPAPRRNGHKASMVTHRVRR